MARIRLRLSKSFLLRHHADMPVRMLHAEKAGPQKRPVAGPRKGFMLEDVKLETITPIPYDILKEGVKT